MDNNYWTAIYYILVVIVAAIFLNFYIKHERACEAQGGTYYFTIFNGGNCVKKINES